MARLHRIPSFLVLCLISQVGYCLTLNGEIKLQQIFAHTSSDSLLASQSVKNYGLTQSSLRVKTYHQTGRWEFDLHYLLNAQYSDDLALLNGANSFPANNERWFDLETNLSQSNSHLLDHKLDRASVPLPERSMGIQTWQASDHLGQRCFIPPDGFI